MTKEPSNDHSPARRTVLAGAGLAGAAAVLSACSSSGGGSGSSTTAAAAPQGSDPATPTGSTPGSPSSAASSAGGTALGATSQVPVGGGAIYASQKVVVTQPTAGEFKAFTAICTHQGCTVSTVSGGTINCPCHGSQYSISTGAVVRGPAPQPLAAKTIAVSNGEISLT